jgi:hypothetical protein
MSKLQFNLHDGFEAAPRPVRLNSREAKALYRAPLRSSSNAALRLSDGPWLASTGETPHHASHSAHFGLWLLLAVLCVVLGAGIAEAPAWLIP